MSTHHVRLAEMSNDAAAMIAFGVALICVAGILFILAFRRR